MASRSTTGSTRTIFMSELAVSYSYKFNDKNSLYLYAGYPGEPALGPPTFMHRTSALNNPDAPISHHWQDATHITWGVITGGVSFGKFKLEASAFKGEEPNENRWDFDTAPARFIQRPVSWNPGKNWALQVSHGYLKNPEPSEPDLKILRKTTASAIYNKRFSDMRNWASTFAWGQNYGNGQRTNSFLFETNYDFDKNAVFGRVERVQKSGHDLVLDHPDEHNVFWVGAFSLGYVRDIFSDKGIDVGLRRAVDVQPKPGGACAVLRRDLACRFPGVFADQAVEDEIRFALAKALRVRTLKRPGSWLRTDTTP